MTAMKPPKERFHTTMKSRILSWSCTALICLIGLAAEPARGQNIYMVGKSQVFTQSESSGAVADPSRPFKFSASAPNATTLISPSGGTMPLAYYPNDQVYGIDQYFATKTALDSAWPNGNYQMTGSGAPTAPISLTTDNYPVGTPQVTSGTWANGMLVVSPGQSTTINFSTFTGYATSGVAGHLSLEVSSMQGDNVNIQSNIISQAGFGMPVSATPLTSLTIPAGALTNGRVYEGRMTWDTAISLGASGGAVALFSKQLWFYIAAQAPGAITPPPVISRQPTNQTGPLGGSATFTLTVTVGGSTNVGNLLTDWYFNGERINLDGTKYAWPPNTFGLTVNNLTAADVGSYTVRLGNAGGFVTSVPATIAISVPTAPTAPTIVRQPVAVTVGQDTTAVLSVVATGTPALTYQWKLNGNNVTGLAGVNGPTLAIPGASAARAGTYTVVVTNSVGSVTSTSALLTISSSTSDPGRLINLSILTPLAGDESMTMGTVLGGAGTSGTKPLLARAAGPALAQLGINSFLPDPTMTLVNTSSTPNVTVATNNDWAGGAALANAFVAVGAFAYASPTSKDAAIFQSSLAPGNYTVQVGDVGNGSGTVIAELYDSTPAGGFTSSTPRLVNVSVLKTIGTGSLLTAGFYVGGSTAKTVLIRAIGPTLGQAPFNIGSAMADPQLTLFNSSQLAIAANNDWGGDPAIMVTASRVGAFAVPNGASKDSMLLITLSPGSYTAQVSPVGAGGTAIVEVYEVP